MSRSDQSRRSVGPRAVWVVAALPVWAVLGEATAANRCCRVAGPPASASRWLWWRHFQVRHRLSFPFTSFTCLRSNFGPLAFWQIGSWRPCLQGSQSRHLLVRSAMAHRPSVVPGQPSLPGRRRAKRQLRQLSVAMWRRPAATRVSRSGSRCQLVAHRALVVPTISTQMEAHWQLVVQVVPPFDLSRGSHQYQVLAHGQLSMLRQSSVPCSGLRATRCTNGQRLDGHKNSQTHQ